jgi:carbonic anhydrase
VWQTWPTRIVTCRYSASGQAGSGISGRPGRSLASSTRTGCGTGFLADAGLRSAVAARTGLDEAALAAEAVVDPAATIRADVERLLSSLKVLPQISVSGHVYDLQTGLVTTIVDPSQPQRAQRPSADAPGTAPAPQPG